MSAHSIPDVVGPGAQPVASCAPDADGSCSLCGDVAVPAVILSIDAAAGIAAATVDGREVTVGVDLLESVAVGDTVLVHQGFAIARVDAP